MTDEVFKFVIIFAVLMLAMLLAGVLIPVLMEFKSLARTLRTNVEKTSPKIDALIQDAHDTTKNVEALTIALRGTEADIIRMKKTFGRTADTFESLEKALRTGTAIGSAVGPALAAFVTSMADGPEDVEQSMRDRAVREATEPLAPAPEALAVGPDSGPAPMPRGVTQTSTPTN